MGLEDITHVFVQGPIPQVTSNTTHRFANNSSPPEAAPEPAPETGDTMTWGECFDQGSDAMCRKTGAMFGGAAGLATFGGLALGMSKFVPVSGELALAVAAAGTVVGAVAGSELCGELGEKAGNWGASVASRNGYSERFGRIAARNALAAAPWIAAAGLLMTLT